MLGCGCARNETAPPVTIVAAPTKNAPTPIATPQPTAKPVVLSVKPAMISRAMWKAAPARTGMKPQTPKFITIHHTAERQSAKRSIEQKLRNLQDFSQRPGKLDSGKTKPAWPDVPYHFYIAADGKIGEGRNPNFAGDTNTEYDPTGHILIVLEGNFEIEKPTAAQLRALPRLTSWLMASYRIAASRIKGHNDYAKTACPGKNIKAEIKRLQQGNLPTSSMSSRRTVKPIVQGNTKLEKPPPQLKK